MKLFKNKENFKALNDTIVSVLGKEYTIRAKRPSSNTNQDNPLADIIKKAENNGIVVEKQ